MIITPTTQSARWLVNNTADSGETLLGETTYIGFVNDDNTVWGEGDEAFLAAANGNVSAFPALPDTGEWCDAGAVYAYNAGAVICRLGHYRTEHDPSDVLALWLVYRSDSDGIDWIAGEQVQVGTVRNYAGQSWRCLQAHVTQADWTPPAVAALWELYEEPGPGYLPWVQPTGAHDAYKIGDRVTLNGHLWESRINANVWSPTVYPAGWLDLGVYP